MIDQPTTVDQDDLIEAVRTRLDDAKVEPGRTWYRALRPDGSLWCETSDPREAAASVAGLEGYTLQQSKTYIVTTLWESWTATPGDHR